ncbi:hypothetical protein ACHAXA_011463 [Cyclostephanos tholiformis]|uniref:Glucosidase 2 subunit beta n=1 Tax=Cyclostephanos tholiformis TaxID=382380 RepID=A0ABD3SEH2_9STRA
MTAIPLLIVVVLLLHDATTLASSSSSSSSSLRCRLGWTTSNVDQELQSIHPTRINDGYCDCPYDGLDEPNTGACSGSTDGMWAGILIAQQAPPPSFGCPRQPALRLPYSRVNDGVCDCCDGADESSSVMISCADICDVALADELAAKRRAIANYEIGSKRRSDYVSEYRKWHAITMDELRKLKYTEFTEATSELTAAERASKDAAISYARGWIENVTDGVLSSSSTSGDGIGSMLEIFVVGIIDVDDAAVVDLASLIISMCALSAEMSSENYANGGCRPLDDASLDVGLMWGDDESSNILPAFVKLDPTTMAEDEALKYAERLLARSAEEKVGDKKKRTAATAASSSSDGKSAREGVARRRMQRAKGGLSSMPDYESLDDDDYYDRDYMGEDEEEEEEEAYSSESSGYDDVDMDEGVVGGGVQEGQSSSPSPDELLVRSLLETVPLDRALFKNRGETLLRVSPPGHPQEDGDSTMSDDDDDGEPVDAPSSTDDGSSFVAVAADPMAVQMVKTTISRLLAGITRGESSARSAARFVASVIRRSEAPLETLRILAAMTMYHSNLALEDVAELIYLTSSALRRSTSQGDEEGQVSRDDGSSSCPPPSNDICPPHIVVVGGKTYPPRFVLEAAQARCKRREGVNSGECAAALEGDEIDFPVAVSDGYYNYHAPRPREPDDGLASVFSSINSPREPPSNISESRKREASIRDKTNTLSRRVADLEREIGGADGSSSKYGVDGELYALRDTCHKVMHGKYEYEVCIFGSATQRDGGGGGNTSLGSWKAAYIEDGRRTLKWEGGAKCWNGPARSAEVMVTCGDDTRLLTANEPETCRYVFTMESPIACDDEFKLKKSF